MSVEAVTIGHVLNETIIFAEGTCEGPVLGSPAAYASLVLARLGVATGIITRAGSDAGEGLLRPLSDGGVDLSGVCLGDITTTNQLVYGSDGSKELRYLKQAAPITSKDIPESYQQTRAFYICPLDYEVQLETVSWLAGAGRILAADLGGYGGVHVNRETYLRKKMPTTSLQELISLLDIVKASDEDCEMLFDGQGLSEEECGQRLVDWGADIAIITLGARGSLLFFANGRYRIPAIEGNVTNVTGGGDSYMGGFLTEFIRTGDACGSAVFASAVALCVIEGTGGVTPSRMPTEEDARKRIPEVIEPVRL